MQQKSTTIFMDSLNFARIEHLILKLTTMKNLIKFLLLLALMIPFNGHAQGKRKKEKMDKPESVTTVSNKNASSTPDNKTVYRLIISFISIGSGTDQVAREKIDAYIAGHGKKPFVDKVQWGREGETDYCLSLKELSTEEQKTFITEIKKLILKPDLVQVKENSARN